MEIDGDSEPRGEISGHSKIGVTSATDYIYLLFSLSRDEK
jgi:hypothetical protein